MASSARGTGRYADGEQVELRRVRLLDQPRILGRVMGNICVMEGEPNQILQLTVRFASLTSAAAEWQDAGQTENVESVSTALGDSESGPARAARTELDDG